MNYRNAEKWFAEEHFRVFFFQRPLAHFENHPVMSVQKCISALGPKFVSNSVPLQQILVTDMYAKWQYSQKQSIHIKQSRVIWGMVLQPRVLPMKCLFVEAVLIPSSCLSVHYIHIQRNRDLKVSLKCHNIHL